MKGSLKVRVLKNNDFRTFEQLCGLTQSGIKKTMSTYLRGKYDKVVETKDYLYAIGDIPIALVAHMDTVFSTPAKEVFYDRIKNVIWSPNGLGADDRAGVFAIIQIIRRGLRPHIILTTDEEMGAVGAGKLSSLPCPFEDLRYLIQLDRRGSNDCVFYDCVNNDFIEYVEKFGFVESFGSFSDISMLCPAWKIAGVNLSIGYRDEHSVSEVLFAGYMLDTIDKVAKMLQEKDIPQFEYIPNPYANAWYKMVYNQTDGCHCKKCGKEFAPTDLIDVKASNSYDVVSYCIDCIGGNVEWCSNCGEPYELPGKDKNLNICEDCWYDFHYNY